jgi:hypothetical protein
MTIPKFPFIVFLITLGIVALLTSVLGKKEAKLPPPLTLSYLYIDTLDQFHPVSVTVHPADSSAYKSLMDSLAGGFVFGRDVLTMTPEDSALLYEVKPYTDAEHIKKDRELRPGMVQQVRVLLERTYQQLKTAGQFKIVPKNPPQKMAIGREFTVGLGIQGVEPKKVVSITTSYGEAISAPDKSLWFWRGTLPEKPGIREYDIAIALSGQDNRYAGKKSVAPETTFTVHAVLPTLADTTGTPIPEAICEKEPFIVNFQVNGLEITSLYSLKLFVNNVESTPQPLPGSSMYEFALPDLTIGTEVRVEGFYGGQPYQYYNTETNAFEKMEHTWRVEAKRTNITGVNRWGNRAGLASELKFSAYRACNLDCPECKVALDERPKVTMTDRDGQDVTDVFLKEVVATGAKNEYAIKFKPEATFLDPENGDDINISISAAGKKQSRKVKILP